jgi:hypothetical protein
MLKFSLSIIHGSREGLSFAATHPRKLLDWQNISDLWRQYPLFSSSFSQRIELGNTILVKLELWESVII